MIVLAIPWEVVPCETGIDPVTTEAKAEIDRFERFMIRWPLDEMRSIEDYMSGYVDGEGCFTVTFNRRPKMLIGWELRPSFSVSQNEDKRQVLDLMQEYFGCGYIRRDFFDKTVKFEIRDHRELMIKVIPHFVRFPLISRKQRDFELFKEICEKVDKAEHLTRNGFAKIVELAYQMNGSGKRRRTKAEIIRDLDSHQDEDIVLSLSQDKVKKEVPKRTKGVTTGGLSQRGAR